MFTLTHPVLFCVGANEATDGIMMQQIRRCSQFVDYGEIAT